MAEGDISGRWQLPLSQIRLIPDLELRAELFLPENLSPVEYKLICQAHTTIYDIVGTGDKTGLI
jgi:hypothetical protein